MAKSPLAATWRDSNCPSSTRAPSAWPASACATRAQWPGARASSSPTTGSTIATTRSCGTASAPHPHRSSPVRRRRSKRPCARPIPPGRYRLAFDLVAENRAWFSELGGSFLSRDVDVLPRTGEPNAHLPEHVVPAPDWEERVRATHAEGFAVVAGAIAWPGGRLHRRPRELAAYEPGGVACPVRLTAPLPVRPTWRRARAARGRRRTAGLCRAANRAVGLRRPDHPDRQSLELDGDAVVDAVEDERAQREGQRGGNDEIDHVSQARQVADQSASRIA